MSQTREFIAKTLDAVMSSLASLAIVWRQSDPYWVYQSYQRGLIVYF
ncbi:MAG: hypothetical protein WBB29_05945 [Geitlerinemataceae cyanobacterium]